MLAESLRVDRELPSPCSRRHVMAGWTMTSSIPLPNLGLKRCGGLEERLGEGLSKRIIPSASIHGSCIGKNYLSMIMSQSLAFHCFIHMFGYVAITSTSRALIYPMCAYNVLLSASTCFQFYPMSVDNHAILSARD